MNAWSPATVTTYLALLTERMNEFKFSILDSFRDIRVHISDFLMFVANFFWVNR